MLLYDCCNRACSPRHDQSAMALLHENMSAASTNITVRLPTRRFVTTAGVDTGTVAGAGAMAAACFTFADDRDRTALTAAAA